MAKRTKDIDPTPPQGSGTALADVASFAQEQRENAPEESAEDIARKALAGATEETANESEQIPTDKPATPPQASGGEIRDKAGELFNPEYHATKKDGSPAYAKSGVFRRRRGTGSRVTIPAAGPAIDPAIAAANAARIAAEAEEQKRRKASIAGAAIAEILFKSGYMLGGDEWLPIKNDEKQIDERRDMTTAWSEYAYARGMEDIPPGLLVFFVCSAYALPRFTGKETQERLSKFGSMVKRAGLWFQNWRLKRAEKRSEKNAPRLTHGNDGERKDHASEGDRARTASE